MIQNYIDLDTQLQPNGFDLTIGEVAEFTGRWPAIIDFSNKMRQISSTMPILLEGGEYRLKPGMYLFRANEFFEMPDRLSGWGMPRSTLSRCGITLNSAIIDAGYSGKLVFVVTISQETKFSKDARFCQMIFFKLNEAPSRLYDGVYKE